MFSNLTFREEVYQTCQGRISCYMRSDMMALVIVQGRGRRDLRRNRLLCDRTHLSGAFDGKDSLKLYQKKISCL